MHRRLLTIASLAGLLALVACRPPQEPTTPDAPPAPARIAGLPSGQPCLELQRTSYDVLSANPANFKLALPPDQVYLIYATPESDTVSPTLTARLGDRTFESTHALANQRYAAVVLQPTDTGEWTIEVRCEDDHSGVVSVRVVKVGSIQPNQRVTGQLTSFSDYCFYRADVTVGNRYQATTAVTGTTSDTLLSLRRLPDLGLHTSNDDAGDRNPGSTLTWTAPIHGTELLCLTAATPRGTGDFTLQLQQLPTPVR